MNIFANIKPKKITTILYVITIFSVLLEHIGRVTAGIYFSISLTPLNFGYAGANLCFIPFVLISLYMVKYYNNPKFKFLIIISCVISFLEIIDMMVYIYYKVNSGSIPLDIINIISFVLLDLYLLKILKSKTYIIIASTLGLIVRIAMLSNVFSDLDYIIQSFFGGVIFFISIIGIVSFYSAFLLIGFEEKIVLRQKTNIIKTMPIEQALKILKECLDNGELNEEEYQRQRLEIISKL